MRSCDSEIHISHGARPEYLSGAFARSTYTPVAEPISPTAEEKPPAPQSVNVRIKPRSRAASNASVNRFSSIGLPICTALALTDFVSAVMCPLEKVAP